MWLAASVSEWGSVVVLCECIGVAFFLINCVYGCSQQSGHMISYSNNNWSCHSSNLKCCHFSITPAVLHDCVQLCLMVHSLHDSSEFTLVSALGQSSSRRVYKWLMWLAFNALWNYWVLPSTETATAAEAAVIGSTASSGSPIFQSIDCNVTPTLLPSLDIQYISSWTIIPKKLSLSVLQIFWDFVAPQIA